MDILQLAKNYGLDDSYVNKLNLANKYIEDSALNDSNIINSQLNQQLSEYERNKQIVDQEAIKDGQSAYIDYAKSINPYGQQSESRYKLGLGNSGLSESSLIGANNSYQNRVTDVVTNKNNIFADIDNKIQQARETSNVELAKIQKQKADRMLENLWRMVEEQENKRRWETEIALQKQQSAKARSSGSSRSNNSNSVSVNSSDNIPSAQEIMKGIKWIQGPNVAKPVVDGISGKAYATVEDLLNSYGYASVKK